MHLFPIIIFRIAERSMEPSLKSGDYVLAYTWARNFKKGDIVMLKHPKKDMIIIKRVSKVVKGAFFVEGDNKKESEDSRSFGAVGTNEVIGRFILKF